MTDLQLDIKVNAKVRINKEVYVVCRTNDVFTKCSNCALERHPDCKLIACTARERFDDQNIYFKKL